MTETYNYWL